MRTDERLGRSYRRSRVWKTDAFSGKDTPELDRRVQDGGRVENGKFLTHSHSGHERNHLFINDAGREFADISAISGLDSIADSRGFVLWDFDRDGWQDIALVNANKPLLNVFRNQIADLQSSDGTTKKMIAIRLVGGNTTAQPSASFGPRDGYGAKLNVTLADLTIQREHRCGDGFAVQNSGTTLVGIGDREYVESVEITWPTGRKQKTGQLAAGTLLTVYEDPAAAPQGEPFVTERYTVDLPEPRRRDAPSRTRTLVLSAADTASPSRIRMFTTMATWCDACKRLQPQLEHLRSSYRDTDLEMLGIPIDTTDTAEKLQAYMATFQPPYRLLVELSAQEHTKVKSLVGGTSQGSALPSTIVTDGDGRVLRVFAGVPTVSDLGKMQLSTTN